MLIIKKNTILKEYNNTVDLLPSVSKNFQRAIKKSNYFSEFLLEIVLVPNEVY